MDAPYFYPDVPVHLQTLTEDSLPRYAQILKELHAGRVWIALDPAAVMDEDCGETLAQLQKVLSYFQSQELEAGVWFNGLGFGNPTARRHRHWGWTRLRSVTGVSSEVDAYCPEDPGFRSHYVEFAKKVAACGPELTMLDDDLCQSVRPGIGCFCHRHLDLMSQRLGEDVVLEGLADKIFTGGPYWRATNRFPGQKSNTIIECTRQQLVWCQNSGVEVFAENDSYPRPAYQVSGKLLEGFEMAMQASGVKTLKYLLDYRSTADYEPMYLKLHHRNAPMYAQIRKSFNGLQDTGVRLYRPMRTLASAVLPDTFVGEKAVMRRFFSAAAAMLTQLSIPVCYAGDSEIGAAFGQDAQFIKKLPKKLILDLPAALILQEKGVDVGLRAWEPMEPAGEEGFLGGERITVYHSGLGLLPGNASGFYRTKLHPHAQVASEFHYFEEDVPASYRYRSGDTEFLVFTFDAASLGQSSSAECSYCRQKQLLDFLGRPWPAVEKQPELYALCKKAEDGHLAVLFENLGQDPLFDSAIDLGRPCRDYTLHGAQATLSADRRFLHLTSTLHPGEGMVLEVNYK